MHYSTSLKITITSLLVLGAVLIAPAVSAQVDSDRDGYADEVEIANNFDPQSPCGQNIYEPTPFEYGKGRLADRSDEGCRAVFLKAELERILGKGKIGISAKNWHTVVNAFIYGGYTPDEIATVIKYGAKTVHPAIPASAWRKTSDYVLTYEPTDPIIISRRQSNIIVRDTKQADTTKPSAINEIRRTTGKPIVVESQRELLVDPQSIAYGFVLDQFSKEAIGNAEIGLYRYGDRQGDLVLVKKTLSNSSGFYQMNPGGLIRSTGERLVLRVTRKLYSIAEYQFNYDPNVLKQIDFRLTNRRGDEPYFDPNELTDDTAQPRPESSKLLTVKITDQNDNPLYDVRIKATVKDSDKGKIDLDYSAYRTNAAGEATFYGILQGTARSAYVTLDIEHDLIEDKDLGAYLKPDQNKKVIKVNYLAPDWVHSRRETEFERDVLVAKQVYTQLEDLRNRNEIEITMVEESTGQEIVGYTVLDLEPRIGLTDSAGIVETDNLEEEMYLINLRKLDEATSEYSINAYAIVNIVPGKRTVATIFINTSDANYRVKDYTQVRD